MKSDLRLDLSHFLLHFEMEPCCLSHLPYVCVCVSALDFQVFQSPTWFLLHCMHILFWFILHFFQLPNCIFFPTLVISVAFSRMKRSAPMSMSFSQTLADFVPHTILPRTMSSTACPYSQSFTSIVLMLWWPVDNPWLLDFAVQFITRENWTRLWLYVGLVPILGISAELSVQRLSCYVWRTLFFPSRLPKASEVATFFFFVRPPQWAFELEFCMLSTRFPFSSEVCTVPIVHPFYSSSMDLSGRLWFRTTVCF